MSEIDATIRNRREELRRVRDAVDRLGAENRLAAEIVSDMPIPEMAARPARSRSCHHDSALRCRHTGGWSPPPGEVSLPATTGNAFAGVITGFVSPSEIRILGTKTELLRTLVAAAGVE